MKLEDQVCNLELSKRLKELGVKQESYFYSGKYGIHDHNPDPFHDEHKFKCVSRFSVAELGELLPRGYTTDKYIHATDYEYDWECSQNKTGIKSLAKKEADARAKMLIYLLENNPIKPE